MLAPLAEVNDGTVANDMTAVNIRTGSNDGLNCLAALNNR